MALGWDTVTSLKLQPKAEPHLQGRLFISMLVSKQRPLSIGHVLGKCTSPYSTRSSLCIALQQEIRRKTHTNTSYYKFLASTNRKELWGAHACSVFDC